MIYSNYYHFVPTKGTKNIATRNVSWPQNIPQNAFAARALPRTDPTWIRRGERKGKEVKGRERRGGERKGVRVGEGKAGKWRKGRSLATSLVTPMYSWLIVAVFCCLYSISLSCMRMLLLTAGSSWDVGGSVSCWSRSASTATTDRHQTANT